MTENRTRAENAALINEALGTELDTKLSSKPNAPVLQDWGDRVGTDPEGVRRDVLAFLVEEALRTELDPAVGTEQLVTWLTRIHAGERDEVLAEVQEARGETPEPVSPTAPEPAQTGPQTPEPAPEPVSPPQEEPAAPPKQNEPLPAPVAPTPVSAPEAQGAEQDRSSPEQATVPAAQPLDDTADTMRVTVNAVIAGYGGTVSDPEQDVGANVIGAQPVEVRLTPTVLWGLGNGTLVEAE